MKSYNMQNASDTKSDNKSDEKSSKKIENDIVTKHKSARNAVLGKSHKSMETEDDLEDIDVDDDPDTESDNESDNESNDNGSEDDESNVDENGEVVLKDSRGFETKLEKPMWKHPKSSVDENGVANWKRKPVRMSVGDWFLTLLILCIPVVNIIMLFIWSFFSDTIQEEKKNFSRANMIIVAILLVLSIVFAFATHSYGLSKKMVIDKANNLKTSGEQYMHDQIYDETSSARNNYDDLTDGNAVENQ